MSLRTIRHPGRASAQRYRAVSCEATPLALTLQAHMSVNAAVAQAFAAAGYRAGWIGLSDIAMDRMDYVIPAASANADHAAWYSETLRPGPGSVIRGAGLHLGIRDGEPYVHCHGTWDVRGRGRRMGHLLPFEAVFSQPVEVAAYGIANAAFIVGEDAETNFRLFSPERQVPIATSTGSRPAILAAVRPNEDICEAIEAICDEYAVTDALVLGIGSLVGARFTDGREVCDLATEVLVRKGRVGCENGALGRRCTLDIDLVGMTGIIASGRLAHGANAVCVTFELLVIPEKRSV